ncbi:MAG TPA: DUF1844 domain-containing protein [Atribacteraceae bacterium]|nr:DUF1844 domain-containing protein [Atribacteraceae bacterium]
MSWEEEFTEQEETNQEERESEKTQKERETVEPGTVKDIGLYLLNLLSVKGWQYLGLMVHPENGKILVDLTEARKAIDLFSLVFNFFKDGSSREEVRDLQAQLSNLQLNFVEKKKGRET